MRAPGGLGAAQRENGSLLLGITLSHRKTCAAWPTCDAPIDCVVRAAAPRRLAARAWLHKH
jgi:hypothetical protein